MVSYHRPKSGHITCYLNRTYHVLLTGEDRVRDLDGAIMPAGTPNNRRIHDFDGSNGQR